MPWRGVGIAAGGAMVPRPLDALGLARFSRKGSLLHATTKSAATPISADRDRFVPEWSL
jgi:hypothetical protein